VPLLKSVLLTAFLSLTASRAFACRCAGGPHGTDLLDDVKRNSLRAAVIFEGTLVRQELYWKTWNTSQGELISAQISLESNLDMSPQMLFTFRVQRAYKGAAANEVQMITGFGGGDCGARYEPGLAYLLYAGRLNTGQLTVSLCSPGGWIGSRFIETDLRFLRKEKPIAIDLEPYRPAGVTREEIEKRDRRNFEANQKRFETLTGKVCGTAPPNVVISFLSAAGYSPWAPPQGMANPDGSFCSPPLGPGTYNVQLAGDSPIAVDVVAGQTQSDVFLKKSTPQPHTVRGFILVDSKSPPVPDHVTVGLIPLSGGSLFAGTQTVDFHGPFSRIKYFAIENVLPGRYLICVYAAGQGWYTRKQEVTVSTHMKLISLDLFHKR
jgi:hypothetical protein